ncbi:MAG TPA: nucleotidyltransferase family protein [Pirellulaceae bacterium]|nr:nucleotidyltransferase family protein [Pirellulaceae bacterium]
MSIAGKPISGWERVARAIEEVRDRLLRATKALNDSGIPYAVLGGNAVAEWVGRIDKGAVRFTKDVDILIRRSDLPAVIEVMKNAGFIFQSTLNVDMFLDGPDANPRDAVHVIYANEKVRDNDLAPAPDVSDSELASDFSVLSLESLVRTKLTSYRDKDRTHLRDMLDVAAIDASWCQRFPPELASRLQHLIDDPNG